MDKQTLIHENLGHITYIFSIKNIFKSFNTFIEDKTCKYVFISGARPQISEHGQAT